MKRIAMLLALPLAGCGGAVTGVNELDRPRAVALPGPAGLPALLAAADLEPQIVQLPSLGSWPRTVRSGGPLYALAQFSPVVAQLGILADGERAEAGYGGGLLVGFRLLLSGSRSLGLEAVWEQSVHNNPASDADGVATRTCGAARLTFSTDQKLHPFAVGGLGNYSLEFTRLDPRFNLGGAGAFFGGGVDYVFSRRISARAEMDLHIWDAAEEGSGHGGVAETLTVVLGAAMSF